MDIVDESDQREIGTCPKCGKPLDAEFPEPLCPACLISGAVRETESATDTRVDRKEAPKLEAVREAFPKLEIIELIGKGGMGAVYKVRQPHLDRIVALKILPDFPGSDRAFAKRFTREAKVLARLNHSSIVTLHDFGQAGGFFFLLMEYVDGVNLRQAMQAGRFTTEQVLDVVPRICEALQFAHGEGILHRDIKPDNILLNSKGQVKIADFGIAKVVGQSDVVGTTSDAGISQQVTPGLTVADSTLGTPQYMAPEQLNDPQTVDHRADVYSLGVVLHEMLRGELPTSGFAPPSQESDGSRGLDAVVLRALQEERGQRQQSIEEMRTEIETIAAATAPAPPSELHSRANTKGQSLAVGALVLALLGLTLLVAGAGGITVGRLIEKNRLNDRVASEISIVQEAHSKLVERHAKRLLELPRGSEQAALESSRMDAKSDEIVAQIAEIESRAKSTIQKIGSIDREPSFLLLTALSLVLICLGLLVGGLHLRRLRAAGMATSFRPAASATLSVPFISLGLAALFLCAFSFSRWSTAPKFLLAVAIFIFLMLIHWQLWKRLRGWLDASPRPMSRTARFLLVGVSACLMAALLPSIDSLALAFRISEPWGEPVGDTAQLNQLVAEINGERNPDLAGESSGGAAIPEFAEEPEVFFAWQSIDQDSDKLGNHKEWWRSDGSSVPLSDERIANLVWINDSRYQPNEGDGPLLLRMAIVHPAIKNLSVISVRFDSLGKKFPGSPYIIDKGTFGFSIFASLGWPEDLPEAMNIRFRLGVESWESPASFRVFPDTYKISTKLEDPKLKVSIGSMNIFERENRAGLTYIIEERGSDRQSGCVAVNRDGDKIAPIRDRASGQTGNLVSRMVEFPIPLDEVAYFQFQFRPIRDFVYENVPLIPNSHDRN
jgi:serine/threonine protein kinase